MQTDRTDLKHESNILDGSSLNKLKEYIKTHETICDEASSSQDYDLLNKSLTNIYMLEIGREKDITERVRDTFFTFNIYPDSTASDYLKNTKLKVSVNKSIAGDWKKVGAQLWLAYYNQVNDKADSE
ncbi:hypothetical protein [Nitrincola sp. MINF-07-Sa-05]|uniref:hypothetical protein n=1 Tax=Nitrincola salilacus TaxID=3400273 RepID=UPI00391846F8